ncbi:MAG: ribbon-helix-helix protein, CopG family [Actinobacteria bacterium]|nr:ribbon-helix-helix protein, CopG family [Actinomycetota bacterium]
MNSKKLNITVPEDTLKEMEQFCSQENVSKSWLIREACTVYIAEIKQKREIEKKMKEMKWAALASKELRNKSVGLEAGKKAAHVIREYRDREK